MCIYSKATWKAWPVELASSQYMHTALTWSPSRHASIDSPPRTRDPNSNVSPDDHPTAIALLLIVAPTRRESRNTSQPELPRFRSPRHSQQREETQREAHDRRDDPADAVLLRQLVVASRAPREHFPIQTSQHKVLSWCIGSGNTYVRVDSCTPSAPRGRC